MILRKAISRSMRVTDPQGTWESLNWINVIQVGRIVATLEGMSVAYDRQSLARTLERMGTDPDFANRRSRWMRVLIRFVVNLGIHRLTVFLPLAFHPIIDCRISKTANRTGE